MSKSSAQLATDLRVISGHLHDRFDGLVPQAAHRVRLAASRLEALTAAAQHADALIQRWRETGNPPSLTEWMALQAECRRAAGLQTDGGAA
jgi:hypothetical protein